MEVAIETFQTTKQWGGELWEVRNLCFKISEGKQNRDFSEKLLELILEEQALNGTMVTTIFRQMLNF